MGSCPTLTDRRRVQIAIYVICVFFNLITLNSKLHKSMYLFIPSITQSIMSIQYVFYTL